MRQLAPLLICHINFLLYWLCSLFCRGFLAITLSLYTWVLMHKAYIHRFLQNKGRIVLPSLPPSLYTHTRTFIIIVVLILFTHTKYSHPHSHNIPRRQSLINRKQSSASRFYLHLQRRLHLHHLIPSSFLPPSSSSSSFLIILLLRRRVFLQ